MWTLTNANTMVEVCEERFNAVVDIRSWRAVEFGLAFRLLRPLGRIGRGGCRMVGAGLKSGWVVGGCVSGGVGWGKLGAKYVLRQGGK